MMLRMCRADWTHLSEYVGWNISTTVFARWDIKVVMGGCVKQKHPNGTKASEGRHS